MEQNLPAKKPWKVWDEFLIAAWFRNESMFLLVTAFLSRFGIGYERLKNEEPAALFASIGINQRSPKIRDQIHGSTRRFFQQFLPTANEMLWEGQQLRALKEMRRYCIGSEQMARDKELLKIKKDFRRTRSQDGPAFIAGTNAVRIRDARKQASDWHTVKPSQVRQRTRRV